MRRKLYPALAVLAMASGLVIHAAPPAAAASSIVVVADVAGCTAAHQPAGSKATVNLIANLPGPVAVVGDPVNGPSTKLTDFRNCFDPFWGAFKSRIRPVPGNHDYLTAGASGYFDYFGASAGDRGKGYYVSWAGSWQLFALNSNCSAVGGCGVGSPMYEWLRTKLSAAKSSCQLAYFHHPRWSQGLHGPNASMAAIYDLLHRAGAEMVLSGHDHTYQRFAALDPTGKANPNGVVQVVAGTGGASHYSFKSWNAPSPVVRNNTAFGVVALDLRDTGWSLRFVPEAGKTFRDTTSGSCHGPNGTL